MASTTTVKDPPADENHHHHLPLLDLNLLSQAELYSLSLRSSSPSSHHNRRCDDDVLIPKIDRSVFNESAGSRKQTYSRLRLAPRNSQLASSSSSLVALQTQTPASEPLDLENDAQIVAILKQLFASQAHDDLVPVRIDVNDAADDDSVLRPFHNVMHSVPIDAVFDMASLKTKRKRGRPRKDANLAIENYISDKKTKNNDGDGGLMPEVPQPVPSNLAVLDGGGVPTTTTTTKRKRGRPRKDENRRFVDVARDSNLVHVNRNGEVVDLVALGNMEDPFGEELRKRTEGLKTDAEFLGFLEGLEGEWATKKMKIVQAREFGDSFPRDWRIMLSIKRREGRVCLYCRRYIRFLPN